MTSLELLCRAALSVAGRGRLVVLTYHRIPPAPDPLLPDQPSAQSFAVQMRFLRSNFNVLPLGEALDALYQGRLPARAAAITFDDGYANNCTVALPVLREQGMVATFFVASGYLDGGRMWNDTVIEAVRAWQSTIMDLSSVGLDVYPLNDMAERRAALAAVLARLKYLGQARRDELAAWLAEASGATLPNDLMMTSAQVRQLSEQGMEVGGHTVTHPILAAIDDEQVRAEVVQNREHLAALTGRQPRLFAYPNGTPGKDFLPHHPALVLGCGYDYALTTAWGAARPDTDRGQVPRVGLWSRSPARMTANLLRAYGGDPR